MQYPLLPMTLLLIATAMPGYAQELKLDDRDLEPFAGESEVIPESGSPSRSQARDALSARYDALIDRLNGQLRQIRIELRERPERVIAARNRLESLEAAEYELRRRAYERVVYRWPEPIFEDFDRAIDEAMERREIRYSLEAEIAENEREIAELERKRRDLQSDLDQALRLKIEAIDEFNRATPETESPVPALMPERERTPHG